jgi:diphthine-ammonia ligase
MKVGVLFSGGKDSMLAAYMASKEGYDLRCLISMFSTNKESYMFHTPSINRVVEQSEVMKIPLLIGKTAGKKEKELSDLETTIKIAVEKYKIKGIVTGAVNSVYQASRVQKICNKLGVECFNPLWQKDQKEILEDLIRTKFKVIITGVFAYPFDESWLGRKLDRKLLKELEGLNKKFGISPSGEGGEFESFVLGCPLFKEDLTIVGTTVAGGGNAWSMEVELG